jgi:ArsR family transcriptional regulator, arsenate/arsenite/antimonite-responsive transcriptional repressor
MELQRYLSVSKALSDRTRVRALMALRDGELCLCQLVCLLLLAPSTLSKHMNVLAEAGLVEREKRGRWQYFSLAGGNAPPEVQRAIEGILAALEDDEEIQRDRGKVQALAGADLETLAQCYRS